MNIHLRKYIFMCMIVVISFGYSSLTHAKSPEKVSFSSQSLKQGEILLINVKVSSAIHMVSGTMFNKPVHFYKNTDGNYTALVGIDMDTKPDRYKLTLNFEDKNGKRTGKDYRIRVKPANFGTQELTLPTEKVTLDEETLRRVEVEKEKIGRIWDIFTEDHLWDGNFIQPVEGEMSGDFGLRRIINGEPKSPHTGADVDAPEGAPVQASNSGVIVFTDDQFFSGKTLVIDHGLGLFTMYFHLSELLVKEGDLVKKGHVIAKVGKTGRATGPHLHWGVRLNGARVNPLSIIILQDLP